MGSAFGRVAPGGYRGISTPTGRKHPTSLQDHLIISEGVSAESWAGGGLTIPRSHHEVFGVIMSDSISLALVLAGSSQATVKATK